MQNGRDAISESLRALEDFHGYKLGEQAMADYLWLLRKHPPEEVSAMVEEWKYRSSPSLRFPSMSDLSKLIFEVKQRKHQETKQSSPTWRDVVDRYEVHGREHGLKAIRLLSRLGTITRRQYIAGMRELHALYPGLGWEKEGNNLQTWYLNRGSPLDEMPARQGIDFGRET